MLTSEVYIQQSLELNLFFMRILKEHAFFMESAFGVKDQALAQQAEVLKNEFQTLLAETLCLADGLISPEVLSSGELVTQMTLDSERASTYYSGILLDNDLTRQELSLGSSPNPLNPSLVDQISSLNQRAISATTVIINYKSQLLQNVLACRTFTFNYPLLIEHILREARFYLKMLTTLQNGQVADLKRDIIEQEVFWNRQMAEHAYFIRSLLDPTEEELFETAHRFGKQFDELYKQAKTMTEQTTILPKLSQQTRQATIGIRDFKVAGTEGLIHCKIKAIMVPLLGDHVVREANHYLRILNTFMSRLH
ncbi:DUF2935 domain-containing protein [Desulfitobacterium metallireducens]|uniref:DUF2935 domain-containing protein n=1 Tax=Desulfitobacterium metallireducens DSM 15288 TaxID=871968 RepID=W0E5Q2_9FIRM|nr:DUF2935 domain-containing protein [Desulfitobacterium metallireducens]AHF06165.1 hypothetical protein DESME_03190 [Desulfitobacterium metallireducens DSM 15288]